MSGSNLVVVNSDNDDCTPNPCQNGGACQDEANAYTCFCQTGFIGTICETSKW